MRRRVAAALLVLAGAAGAADRPPESLAERDTVGGVVGAVEAKDCERAVSRLNEGLARKYTGIYLLAGAMYQEGLCLRPNPERAARLYQRAWEGGHRSGLYRLVALYALPGRDAAAALWWAATEGFNILPGACRVSETVRQQPEAFVAALRGWPAEQLAACTYAAGVTAAVFGDAEYPGRAAALGLAGRVHGSFAPAAPRIEWTVAESETKPLQGVVSADKVGDQNSKFMRDELRRYLTDIGERALRRYPHPEGLDPAWKQEWDFVFQLEYR